MNLDFKKYKRIFAFGCSFTNYIWPSWADVIAYEAPDCEYFNYGMAGAGNLLISARVTEANKRYKFCESDLVMVMWSTFCREDRWVEDGWLARGNIWNSNLYSDEWVKKFADPLGYLIRDHAIINSANGFIKNLLCDSLLLKSTDFSRTESDLSVNEKESTYYDDLKLLYLNDYNEMPLSLYEFMESWDLCQQKYFDDVGTKTMRYDGHPFTGVYADYLKIIGIDLSTSTHEWAQEATMIVKKAQFRSHIDSAFEHVMEGRRSNNFKLLF